MTRRKSNRAGEESASRVDEGSPTDAKADNQAEASDHTSTTPETPPPTEGLSKQHADQDTIQIEAFENDAFSILSKSLMPQYLSAVQHRIPKSEWEAFCEATLSGLSLCFARLAGLPMGLSESDWILLTNKFDDSIRAELLGIVSGLMRHYVSDRLQPMGIAL